MENLRIDASSVSPLSEESFETPDLESLWSSQIPLINNLVDKTKHLFSLNNRRSTTVSLETNSLIKVSRIQLRKT